MKENTLFQIYTAIAEGKKPTRGELAQMTGLSAATISCAVKQLRRSGLIKEHYIRNRSCFSCDNVMFMVFDASDNEFLAYCYDEMLYCYEVSRYNHMPEFALHDSLRSFISNSLRCVQSKKVVSFCLIPPKGYDVFCSMAIPDYVASVHIGRDVAASSMRKKYFSVKLRMYREKVLQKRSGCDIM